MAATKARGSSNLDKLSKDALIKSISAARDSYTVERWWKYGQPRIHLIRTDLNVNNIGAVGGIVTDLLKQHGDKMQVGIEVFPYGIVNPEGAHIKVHIENKIHQ